VPRKTVPPTDLVGLGKKGPGQYSSGRANRSHVVPNIIAMSPRQFRRYIRKLRTLRPEFQAFVKARAEQEKAEGKVSILANKSLFELSQNTSRDLHREFLMQYTESHLRSSQGIEPQPHRTGGLLYTHPSPLDTFFYTKPRPGLVLESRAPPVQATFTENQAKTADYIVSFGGLTTVLVKANAQEVKPLFNFTSEEGLQQPVTTRAIADMRLTLKDGAVLHKLPKVVGHHSQGLEGVTLITEVSAKNGWDAHGRDNTYFPGTAEYVGMDPSNVNQAMPITDAGWAPHMVGSIKTPAEPTNSVEPPDQKNVIGILRGLLSSKKETGDPDLDSNL